jgi:hypothetical protein
MRQFICTVVAGVFLFNFAVFAEGLKVEDSQGEYVTKIVTAKNVKGVKVGLMKEEIRYDCNELSMGINKVLISDGWYDKYFLEVHISMLTKMNCLLREPEKVTLYSNPIFIKSSSGKHEKNEVRVSIIIPKGSELKVVEIKLSDPDKEIPDHFKERGVK